MMTPMFQELIDSEVYTFPQDIDEVTKSLLIDFFGMRRTGKNFARFFDRDLAVYYPQYKELLRVNPPDIKIDWFVENYLERQLFEQNAENRNGVENSAGNSIKVINGTKYSTNNKSGTDTGWTKQTKDLTDERTYEEDYDTNNMYDEESESASDANSRQMAFARANPMSQSYTDKDMRQLFDSKAQTLSAGGTFTNGGKTYGIAYPMIKNPSTSSDGLTMNADVRHDISDYSLDVVGHKESSDTLTKTGTDREDRNLKNSELNILNASEDGRIADTKDGHKQTLDSTEGTSLYQDIQTGRNTLPADVLEKAKGYIQSTNAFMWFKQVLDKNFKQCYRMEDYV